MTPSALAILASYDTFRSALPGIAHDNGLDLANLPYPDFERLVLSWVRRVPLRR
jgi:hypothetical protein